MPTVEEVTKLLSGFKDVLQIEQEKQWIIIRATKWISPEDYAKISTLIKEVQGERIVAGKMSHWRVPISTTIVGIQTTMKGRLILIRSELDKIIEEMQ